MPTATRKAAGYCTCCAANWAKLLSGKAFRAYYAKYDGGNANTDDLRAEMEKASGQNLEQFFKQWVYTAGAPHLNITWRYDAIKKAADLTITQKQAALFDFPLEVSIDGKQHTLSVKNKITTLTIPLKMKPTSVIADPNVNLLAAIDAKEAIQ